MLKSVIERFQPRKSMSAQFLVKVSYICACHPVGTMYKLELFVPDGVLFSGRRICCLHPQRSSAGPGQCSKRLDCSTSSSSSSWKSVGRIASDWRFQGLGEGTDGFAKPRTVGDESNCTMHHLVAPIHLFSDRNNTSATWRSGRRGNHSAFGVWKSSGEFDPTIEHWSPMITN